MADYQLTSTDSVLRTEDGAYIPNDPANRDWIEYQEWLAVDGNTPLPYVEPEPVPPEPSTEQALLYEHENRLRALEGAPPLSQEDFIDKMNAPP